MKQYDTNLYLLTALRARIAVLSNVGLGLVLSIAAFNSSSVIERRAYLSAAVTCSVSGILALRTAEMHKRAQEDVSDISDQARTNSIYERLTSGDSDFSAQLYNYIVMELSRGKTTAEILSTLDKDADRAKQLWIELEDKYGKLPTGGY